MKKTTLTLIILFFITSIGFASGHVDSTRYLTTRFYQNWFLSANGNMNMWRGSDRNINGNYRTFNGPSFGYGVAAGKQFTHKIALRIAYDNNASKSYLNGAHTGLPEVNWLIEDPNSPDTNGYFTTSFFYHNLHADIMFSSIDFLNGYYNPERVYTPVVFAGMGLACVSNNISLIASDYRNFEFSFDAGLQNNFRLNKYFDINLELRYSMHRWSLDSWTYEYGITSVDERPKFCDQNFAVSLGLTYYLGGRIYELPKNFSEELFKMKETIDQLEREMADAVGKPIPCDTVVKVVTVEGKQFVSYPFSIFFNIDSYELMSNRDLVNLNEIAKIAVERNLKVRLTGSADAATASPSYNKVLSENRCRKITMELTRLGVPIDNIITIANGGISILEPTAFDRRVIVELLDEEK
jgi:Outer membrane protein and related peptidoglycan-associated (lipo)proteins